MPPKCCSERKERSTRMKRTAFTDEQIEILEHTYKKHQYVLGNKREKLALLLNLPVHAVKNWFKNKRRVARHINNDYVEDSKYSKYMKQSNSKMAKKSKVKKRRILTKEQTDAREIIFQKQKDDVGDKDIHELAIQFGVPKKTVSDWFKYENKGLRKLGNKRPSVRQDETLILLPQQAACIVDYELPVDDHIIKDQTLAEYVSGFVDQTLIDESLLKTDYDEESIDFPELPSEILLPEVQQSRDESWIQDLAQIDTVNSSSQAMVGAEMCSIEAQYSKQENFTNSEFYSEQENTCDYHHFSVFRMLNTDYC